MRSQKPATRNQRKKTGFIFVISGPSGSGKTTLAKKLLGQPQLKGKFVKPASFTTRPKREGERRGQDYCFVSQEEFKRLLKAKKILEHTRYLGYYYGTPRDFIERALKNGLNVILCLDIKGARFVKQEYPDKTVTIFIKPPSINIAKKRILVRSSKTQAQELHKRMQLAARELEYSNRYDYCLVNDNLNRAIKKAKEIVEWTICHQ